MDIHNLLQTSVLSSLSEHSLTIPEINWMVGLIHNSPDCFVKIVDVLTDILSNNCIDLADIPNIVLLVATIFKEAAKESEMFDTEYLLLLIQITSMCILETDPKIKIYEIDVPYHQPMDKMIDCMIHSCMELLRMDFSRENLSDSKHSDIPLGTDKCSCSSWSSWFSR